MHEPWCNVAAHGPENDICTSAPTDVHGVTTWLTAAPGEQPRLVLGDADLDEDATTALRDHLDGQLKVMAQPVHRT